LQSPALAPSPLRVGYRARQLPTHRDMDLQRCPDGARSFLQEGTHGPAPLPQEPAPIHGGGSFHVARSAGVGDRSSRSECGHIGSSGKVPAGPRRRRTGKPHADRACISPAPQQDSQRHHAGDLDAHAQGVERGRGALDGRQRSGRTTARLRDRPDSSLHEQKLASPRLPSAILD